MPTLTPQRFGSALRLLVVCSVIGILWPVSAETRRPAVQDATSRAVELLASATQGKLDDRGAQQAALLLADPDPFVRGLAEWAIATKVGKDNNGQEVVWPRRSPPDWYQRWTSLDAQALLEADWVRQAFSAGIHEDSARLVASIDDLWGRLERMSLDGRIAARDSETANRLGAAAANIHRLADELRGQPNNLGGIRRAWLAARRVLREAVLAASPATRSPLLFVKQFAAHTTPNISRGFAWQHKPGGDICLQDSVERASPVRSLLGHRLGPGHVRNIDLWWDADRVAFAYAKQQEWPPAFDTTTAAGEAANVVTLRKTHPPLRIYELNLAGTGLRQRTDHPYWNDYEPTYSADGDIFFSSDRCARAAECGTDGYEVPNFNLYRVDSHGRVSAVTANKDVDRYPHSLDNGLIAFTRWEYQERHFFEVHSLWTVRPDGTMADALFKQHLAAPYSLRDVRSIPASRRLVAIGSGHHNFAYGPLLLVDPRGGLNAAEGIRVVTPGVVPQEGPPGGQPVPEGGVADQGGLYQTPWPLSETTFLVAYAYARNSSAKNVDSNGFAVYLVDVFGNKELVARDLLFSCVYPIPVRRRKRPPQLPPTAESTPAEAVCNVADVYAGLTGVPRGTVRSLRIAQRVPWPFDPVLGMLAYVPGHAYQAQFGYWDWAPVRVLGTVPVEEDGSASFVVPANVALYFQAIDHEGMEVRRMRSMVGLAPGETRSCRGCHESQAKAPAPEWRPGIALQKPPVRPVPPSWGDNVLLDYEAHIQPILDRRCLECHDASGPRGAVELSSRRAADGFLQSFRTMFGVAWEEPTPTSKELSSIASNTAPGQLVAISNRFSSGSVTAPRQFGSSKSRLIAALADDDHRGAVRLTADERLALIAWVDANAPYYGTFLQRRSSDGKPLDPPQRVAIDLESPAAATAGQSWFRVDVP